MSNNRRFNVYTDYYGYENECFGKHRNMDNISEKTLKHLLFGLGLNSELKV